MNLTNTRQKIKNNLPALLSLLLVLGTALTPLFAQDNNDVWTERWISCALQTNPNPNRIELSHWINYEFDSPQAISSSHFWNANFTGESEMGAKEVWIDYSIDGVTWETLGNSTFPKAPENDEYTGFAGPDFGGVFIKKILITIVNTYGDGTCASLAEVRFNIDPNACYGQLDECEVCDGPGILTWYIDQDQDGLGNPEISLESCDQPVGYVDNNDDPCDNGAIGWESVGVLFDDNACTGCHSGVGAGGLNLESYAGIKEGGNNCGMDLLTGNTLVSIISIDNYVACGTPISFPSMNQRVGEAFDAQELALIQAWIDGGALEDCADPNLCDNQEGDTDGDGVCNEVDNCIDIANPDQVDSDGNGIGDACEATDPCTKINAVCSNNTITISGLSTPVAQLIVFDANWQTIFSCSGDCNETETIIGEEGRHYFTAKLYTADWQSICQITETVECTGINTCQTQGGDSDGDGICNDEDNCIEVANPDQLDSDGNGIGDACESTDPCADINFACSENVITVSGLSSPVTQLIVFDAAWQDVYICSGDCNETATIAVSEGTHYVIARLYTATWQPICERSETLECTNTNPCANQGGDSDGDGICNEVDNCVDLVNPDQLDSDGNGVGDACDSVDPCSNIEISCTNNLVTVSGLTGAPVTHLQVFDSNWQTVFNCAGDCNEVEMVAIEESTHHVIVTYFDANWQFICKVQEDFNCADLDLVAVEALDHLFFQVYKQHNAAQLQWVINTDEQTAFFEIERSREGRNFDWIETVPSDDSSGGFITYQFTDRRPNVGLNYYRIKQIFKDGQVRFSEIKEIQFEEVLSEFRVYPNPADEEIFVELSSFEGMDGVLYLHDILGDLVLEQSLLAIAREPYRMATPVGLASGVYTLSLKIEGQRLKTVLLVIARK